MSVIIRLQNLPWSANALDIRQFFKGLSIPDGGVHIVGGEMGDAFIAFSTDEDARQAMMNDRKIINEVQVRLLLSSRAEMQKVIETARQQSILALKNASALAATIKAATVPSKPQSAPQPPVITPSSLHNILSTSAAPSFLAYQKQAGITLIEPPTTENTTATESASTSTSHRGSSILEKIRDRRRSSSRDRRRSRSRERNDRNDRNSSRRGRRDRSHSRSRERDWKSRRSNRRSRSRDRSHDRNRDRSVERGRNPSNRNNTSNKERDTKDIQLQLPPSTSNKSATKLTDLNESSQSVKVASIPSWGIPAMNSYQTNTTDNNTTGGQESNSLGFTVASTSANLVLNPFSMSGGAIPGLRTSPQLANSYTTSTTSNKSADTSTSNMASVNVSSSSGIPGFQNYTTSALSSNNYSINLFNSNSNSNDSAKHFALQNPYTAAIQQQSTLNTKSQESTTSNAAMNSAQSTVTTQPPQNNTMFPGLSLMDKPTPITLPQGGIQSTTTTPLTNYTTTNQLPQEPIAFANTNPYAQIYPNLFAQAAAAANLPKPSGIQQKQREPEPQQIMRRNEPMKETCCVKISNMCGSTTYSDVRKFFMGLFIPHNGIKMVNDKHGTRIGVAYIQFSRVSSVHKALMRNNTLLKTKIVKIEIVCDEEFEQAEDSYRPQTNRYERGNERNYQDNRNDNNDRLNDDDNSDGGGDSNYRRETRNRTSDFDSKAEPFKVLYIEDIPSSAVEHDLMRMFSSYTIFDILLTPSRENRREFKGHVLFSRSEEAKAALEDRSTHMIGYRKVRVRPGSVEEMEREKEKVRLANEQLMKEEEALAEAERFKEEENRGEDDMDVADDDEDENNFNDGGATNFNDNPTQSTDEQTEQYNSADPRTTKIPSLFDVPTIKSDDLLTSDNDVKNAIPSDPRLRSRQKKSRFEPLKPEDEKNLNMNLAMGMSMSGGNNGNMGMNDGPMGMGGNMGMSMSNMGMNDNNMGMSSNMNMCMNDNNSMGMNNNNNNNNMGMNMNMNSGGNFLSSMMNNNNNNDNNNMNNMNMNYNNNCGNSGGMENNFILMKNCDYNTRMNDIAELLQSAYLRLKHIEPLRGDRNMPTGEFIVEFQDGRDAETAIRQFNSHTLRQRKLRIRSIKPQEIADRIGKPFLNCYPGGGGGSGGNGGGSSFSGRPFERNQFSLNDGPSSYGGSGSSGGGRYGSNNMNNDNNNSGRGGGGPGRGSRNNMGSSGFGGGSGRSDHSGSSSMRRRGSRFNNSTSSHDGHSDDDVQIIDDSSNDVTEIRQNCSGSGVDDDDSGGIPQKFTRPGCVLAMENVPYKAELADILKFFSGYDLTPDDIIRRFNDDGTPTGDARVAFATPSIARAAYNSRRRKQIFSRTIRLALL